MERYYRLRRLNLWEDLQVTHLYNKPNEHRLEEFRYSLSVEFQKTAELIGDYM
jgi:hypothetical protein